MSKIGAKNMSDYDYDFIGYDEGMPDYYESYVIASNNAEHIYSYSITFKKDDNITALDNKLAEIKDIKYSLKFLRDVKGTDITKHFDYLIDAQNFKICYFIYSRFYDKLDWYQKDILNFALKATAKSMEDFDLLKEIECKKSNQSQKYPQREM